MCLYKVDEILQNHRIGYKLFKLDEKRKQLQGLYFGKNTIYPRRKWINDTNTEVLSGYYFASYESGFHYYLDRKEAEELARTKKDCLLYKILVRRKICTGIQENIRAGVSKEIFIKERVKIKVNNNLERYRYYHLKQALKVKDIATIQERIYKEKKKGLDVISLYKKLSEVITADMETFCEWIIFIDHFWRKGERFKITTDFHLFSLKNFPKHKECYNATWHNGGSGFVPQPHLEQFNWKTAY